MKKYHNRMEATEFTRAQVGILYKAAKDGHIRVPSWVMTEMYEFAGFYGYANDRIREAEETVLAAIDFATEQNWQPVQNLIDDFAELFPETGMKRTSRNARFIRGKDEAWKKGGVLEDLMDYD